jgi:predicted HTH domain antitoxin
MRYLKEIKEVIRDMDKVTVSVELPRSICAAAGVREAELAQAMRESLAVELYRQGRISLGKASETTGVSPYEMIQILARHDVFLSYDMQDAATDFETLREFLPE